MNFSPLTIVGMIAVIAGYGLTYLLNREKITWSIRILLAILTLVGLIIVGYSDHDLNENIVKLQSEADKLRNHVTELSKPTVEFIKGAHQYDPKDSLWYAQYNFRTNPAFHARDVAVTVVYNDPIVKAFCTRNSDAPGISATSIVPVSWVEEPISFEFKVDFLAADETLQVVVVSRDSLNDPQCDIKTWSKKAMLDRNP